MSAGELNCQAERGEVGTASWSHVRVVLVLVLVVVMGDPQTASGGPALHSYVTVSRDHVMGALGFYPGMKR